MWFEFISISIIYLWVSVNIIFYSLGRYFSFGFFIFWETDGWRERERKRNILVVKLLSSSIF